MADMITQHKCMAMGDTPDVPAIESPFAQVRGSSIPRGEMKDSKRKGGMSESPYDNDGDRDY